MWLDQQQQQQTLRLTNTWRALFFYLALSWTDLITVVFIAVVKYERYNIKLSPGTRRNLLQPPPFQICQICEHMHTIAAIIIIIIIIIFIALLLLLLLLFWLYTVPLVVEIPGVKTKKVKFVKSSIINIRQIYKKRLDAALKIQSEESTRLFRFISLKNDSSSDKQRVFKSTVQSISLVVLRTAFTNCKLIVQRSRFSISVQYNVMWRSAAIGCSGFTSTAAIFVLRII